MTQIEAENKLREIKMIYSDRAHEFIKGAQPLFDDISKKKEVAIEEFNKAKDELEKSLTGLKQIGNELRRKGFANFSLEVENNTKDKDEVKGKLRELRANFNKEMLRLNELYKSHTRNLNNNLAENSKMRAKAKQEIMVNYQSQRNS